MKRTLIIIAIVAITAILIMVVVGRVSGKNDVTNLYAEAKKGRFEIVVTTTGELEAENSKDINGPDFLNIKNIRAFDIKISNLVPEGTLVKKGDYVATLDRSSLNNSLRDEQERINTLEANLRVKMLDTAVVLSNLRDNIKNLNYTVTESQNILVQSKYEPPVTLRQAEISLDKARRAVDQAYKAYALRVEQVKSDIYTLRTNLSEQHKRVADLESLLSKFVINAPSDGMVIYKREENGTKRKTGSSISLWDNVVATLPDMSTMVSRTYVNEIDIDKIKTGQKVEIRVDAFPRNSYTGVVTNIANIGEQLPNADAKVFEVLIRVDGSDPVLRPSMTTENKIIIRTFSEVTHIPLECLHTGADSISFVYTKSGHRQIVLPGESNENNIIIEQGLEPGTTVYMTQPVNAEKFRLKGEEMIVLARNGLKQEAPLEETMEATEPGSPVITEKITNSRPLQKVSGSEIKPGSVRPAAPGNTINPDGVVYRVQFMANKESKGSYEITLDGQSYNTYEYFYSGAWRTCAGEFTSKAQASGFREVLNREGYKDAFVVAFRNNERILE